MMVDAASQTISHNGRVARLGPLQCLAVQVLVDRYPSQMRHSELVGRLSRADGGPSSRHVTAMLSAIQPKLQRIGLDIRRIHGGRGGSTVSLVQTGES